MSQFLNPVSYGIAVLGLVVGSLTLYFNSMTNRPNGWLERAFCAGGFVLSAVCTVDAIANGPYRYGMSTSAVLGGAGIAFGVIGATALILLLLQAKRTGG